MKLTKIALLTIVLSALGCASKNIKLVSDPPAQVFVSSDFSSEFTELGTTPLDIKLKDHASNDKFTYLAFKAEGYDGYRVVLPSAYSAGTVEIKLNQNEDIKDIEERVKASMEAQVSMLKGEIVQVESTFKERSNQIFHKVMEVQNALNLRKMAKAAKSLAELKRLEAPDSLVLTLEGNFAFINGKPKRALATYRRALQIDPSNVELSGVLRELEEALK